MKTLKVLAITAVLTGTLAACSNGDSDSMETPSPSAGPSPTTSSDGATSPEPSPSPMPEPGTRSDDFSEEDEVIDAEWLAYSSEVAWPSVADWTDHDGSVELYSIRVGDLDDVDRVVLDLDAEEQPGWRVKYDAQAEALRVDLNGVPDPSDSGQVRDVPVHALDELDEVESIYTEGPVDGRLSVFLEVDDDWADDTDDESGYRVKYLENPSRLVIDVRED